MPQAARHLSAAQVQMAEAKSKLDQNQSKDAQPAQTRALNDLFAAKNASAGSLVRALVKLYEDNAATLTPDPLYVKFYYSHPPASERLGRMLATT